MLPATHPALVLALAALATTAGVLGAARLEPEVDFLATVPADEPGLDAYRALLERLDGVRFVAVYMPADPAGTGGGDLRSDAGFDALVRDQQRLTEHLLAAHPGEFTHTLSVYEAMRAGNYMLHKVATAGNPPPSAYALPQDQVSWSYVRDEVRGESGKDVLAADGSSALLLAFLATDDAIAARHLAADVADDVVAWGRSADPEATGPPQASGLLVASAYTDERNARDLRVWGLASMAAAGAALLVAVRRPGNVLIAAASIACATAWTFGVLGAVQAPISFLTVFLAPLLAGVGVDYAVHVLQRYEEERDAGHDAREAVATALRTSGGAAAVSAVVTAAGLLALLAVPAPLFAQVGWVAALGVAFGFLSSVTVAPALRAVLPERRRPTRSRPAQAPVTARRSVAGVAGQWSLRHPVLALGAVLLLTGAAAWVASTQVRTESGSSENEFPQDDPMVVLQRRIEEDYGAFQRAYLVVQGDLTQPDALRALHDAKNRTASLPLYRDASAVTDLLIADDATDEGALDFTLAGLMAAMGQPVEEEQRLPATPAEARSDLDRLFADPLWRTIAPFTISRDYGLAVVAVQVDPWSDQTQLVGLRDALRVHAADLQTVLGPDYDVQAAGSPVNRAAVVEQTPDDVAIAIVGVAILSGSVLLLLWVWRGWKGLLATLLCLAVVLAAAAWLLASVPLLDGAYRIAESWGAPANRSPLTDMVLLAFAITVAAGVDNLVHLVHRHWEARRSGLDRTAALADALEHGGRAITGTSATTFVAFAALAGVYFLQSKNLAVLAAAGVLYAWVLTMLVGPWILKATAGHDARQG